MNKHNKASAATVAAADPLVSPAPLLLDHAPLGSHKPRTDDHFLFADHPLGKNHIPASLDKAYNHDNMTSACTVDRMFPVSSIAEPAPA